MTVTSVTAPCVASLPEAEAWTRQLARSHYENFMVVSWLLPRRLHQDMFNVYAYCRSVDDLGDEAEGDRLALLDGWRAQLNDCFSGADVGHPVFLALRSTIRRHELPKDPFEFLIRANEMDQRVQRYDSYGALLDYCHYSANPVGRLVLMLFGYRDERRFELSDATCTALQLANFWQDVANDYDRGRVYIPQEDLRAFGYSDAELAARAVNDRWRQLMRFEVDRARRLFHEGSALIPMVQRRLQLDLRLFTLGGLEILNRIEARRYDVLTSRPATPAWRQLVLLVRALGAMIRPAAQSPSNA